jgi:hypothetical protein
MRPRRTKRKGFRIIFHAKSACLCKIAPSFFLISNQQDKLVWRIVMHIPPVHNRCALDFVIDGFGGKYTVSQADSKPSNLARSQDANFETPLYTGRRGDRFGPHEPPYS